MRTTQHTVPGPLVDRYEYGDRTVIAADLGPAAAPSVDVVGETAILVDADGAQHEIELPSGSAEAFNRNGVVTIEVTQ